jgi:molybdopterin-containing oxidoreductase family membrane subunit
VETVARFWRFVAGSASVVAHGDRYYYLWLTFLVLVIAAGLFAYGNQALWGLVTSNMRDQFSWGFYIGNFTFLVGVAASAVVLVIPAYVYHWGPIREIVLIGELLAVSAVVMCILFVTVDLGRPEVLWHLMPGVGTPNFPYSLLIWDILVLNSYLVLNYLIVTYFVYKSYSGRPYNYAFIMPVIFLSIPVAILIHTVTAFLFMGLVSRPFWHTAILAPRFLASAFCSGPALLLLIFQILRRFGRIAITDEALHKIGELLAYAMGVNLFLLGCEVFNEFYFPTAHAVHGLYQWFGAHGRFDLAVYTWLALACNGVAFVLFVLAVGGIFIEKGLGLLIPGMTPDVLGEVYAYNPSLNEVLVGAGVWGVGALVFTLMVKVVMAIDAGEFRDVPSWERAEYDRGTQPIAVRKQAAYRLPEPGGGRGR